ncbi:MAG: penicillin-binding protein 2 [Myxococcota bacterium]|nr:penicillin-binding protein 2 [Myxococcota bacterium]
MSWSQVRIRLRPDSQPRDLHSRLGACAIGIALVFAIFVGRLWVLQVVQGDEFAVLAQSNTLKKREIPAPRGSIYDAHGNRIAEVHATFDLVISPSDVLERDDTVVEEDGLAGALGGPPRLGEPSERWTLPSKVDALTLGRRLAPLLDNAPVEETVRRLDTASNRWRPVVLREDLNPEELTRIMVRRPWLPGVRVVSRHRRVYPDGDLFAHLVGYQREVHADELMMLRERYAGTEHGADWYRSGDRIGKYGLESAYEPYLRGTSGQYWVQVDVHGRELGRSSGIDQPGDEYFRSIAHFLDRRLQPEVPGHDLHLTLRSDLQKFATRLLGNQSGSVVMMEVDTGRILTLANAPRFDPEIFSKPITPEDWALLRDDPRNPLVDKSVQGIYPPGSTWKMIAAAALLGSDTWTPRTRVHCDGSMKVGKRSFRCWNRSGHGSVNLREALAQSCDVYFYRAGLAVGIDEIARYASMFGMGRTTGVGINSEMAGINPNTAWKKSRFTERPKKGKWTAGDTASAVIGQGFTLATPLQLTRMTAAFANGGTLYRPLLVDRVVGPNGEVVQHTEPEIVGHADLAPEHFRSIQDGMFGVVEDLAGTARRQRIKELAYAGKTGTAQVVSLATQRRKRNAANSDRFKDHAWFVAFAPYENPEVAITVLIENGGHGSTAAAPIARKMFEYYFNDRIAGLDTTKERLGHPEFSARRSSRPASAPTPKKPSDSHFVPVPGLSPEDL